MKLYIALAALLLPVVPAHASYSMGGAAASWLGA